MSWRIVVISSNAKADYKMDYLVVRTVDEVKRIHLSEVGVLMVESTAVSITSYLLCELVKRKIDVIFCDRERNPYFELVPFAGCHDSNAKIRRQIKWPSGIKQSVWTELVRQKILRQKKHLVKRELPEAAMLDSYLKELQFNDSGNREGHAAKVYFNALFGMDFTRAADNLVNAALNYGYSILLSAINREISAAGYLNQLGVFHDNVDNPFNLGCDFIEPLRPLVDAAVVDMKLEKFEHDEKMFLVDLMNKQVRFDGNRQRLLFALHLYCGGLFRALQSNDMSEIKWIDYE